MKEVMNECMYEWMSVLIYVFMNECMNVLVTK